MSTAEAPPWWQQLPEDFYRQPDSTELDQSHWLQVRSTAALDRVARTGLGTAVSLAMAASLASGRKMQEQRRLLRFYQQYADQADPAAVFSKPDQNIVVHRSATPSWIFRPKGIHSELLSFDSKFEPLCSKLGAQYARHKRNLNAHAQYWRHPDGPRRTLIFIHGYVASGYRLNSWAFSLPWFYKHGYDVMLYTLPFHGARRDCRHLYNGQGYFADGFAHMNETMRHAVLDVRVLMDFLQRQDAPSIGVSGLSLGGYLAALLAAVDDRLAFSIPNSPLVVPLDMALEWQPTGMLFKWLMHRDGISLQELRHGLALHSPLTYKPLIDNDRLMIIGGAGDRFTPPRYVRLLHEHWQGSHLHWFPGNHILHLQQGEYLRLMKAFMDRNTRGKLQ